MTPEIRLRPAVPRDLDQVALVESRATPGLRYLARVYGLFLSDPTGDFSVAEVDGRIVGCGKFTLQPDGSAWLEALRVLPAYQGLGVGKEFYRRFLDISADRGVTTLRMYTNVGNRASKGLAERFCFRRVAVYRGAWAPAGDGARAPDPPAFWRVGDPGRARDLLMPRRDLWTGFSVMNRTFYALTPELATTWSAEGKIYEDASGGMIALGARFMPEQALHIAMAAGDMDGWLSFARWSARSLGAPRVQCMYPPSHRAMESFLRKRGFQLDDYDCIVMERTGGG